MRSRLLERPAMAWLRLTQRGARRRRELLFLETGELPPWHRADPEVSGVPDVMPSDADEASTE